jgi:hypothetical protein
MTSCGSLRDCRFPGSAAVIRDGWERRIAAHINEWLTSPGLSPPIHYLKEALQWRNIALTS